MTDHAPETDPAAGPPAPSERPAPGPTPPTPPTPSYPAPTRLPPVAYPAPTSPPPATAYLTPASPIARPTGPLPPPSGSDLDLASAGTDWTPPSTPAAGGPGPARFDSSGRPAAGATPYQTDWTPTHPPTPADPSPADPSLSGPRRAWPPPPAGPVSPPAQVEPPSGAYPYPYPHPSAPDPGLAAGQAVAPTPGTGPDAVWPVLAAPAGEIATWPPLPPPEAVAPPVNPVTGQLRRPWALVVTSVCCWLAGLGWAGAFALFWWQAASVSGFHRSARILTWTEPAPVSFWAIFLVGLIALLTVMVIGVAVAVGYNAWRGQGWTRWGGLIGLVLVAGLSWTLHPWAIFAVIPYAVAAGLLWLPGVKRHCAAVAPTRSGPANPPVDPSPVLYGPHRPIGG